MRSLRLPLLLALAAAPAAAGAAPVTENLHGYAVTDAHRHLETDAGAKSWIDRQNGVSEKFFAKLPGRAAMEKRIDALSRVGGVSGPEVVGDRTFFTRRTGDQEQPVLYVRDANGAEKTLVDPMALDKGGKVALDWYYPSPSGNLVAYGLSRDGSEDSVLHLIDVATGKQIGETIPYTRHASIAWLPDDSGFYYTRYPKGDRYNRHVYFHVLGNDSAKDPYVFGKQNEKTDWTDVKLTPDGKRLFVNVSKGWAVSELWMLDREKKGEPIKVVPASLKALFSEPTWIDGRIVLRTNHEAPKFRIVSVDPAQPQPGKWKTLVAEGEWPIDGMRYVGGKLAVVRLEKAVSKLELYGKDGKPAGKVQLPDLGAIFETAGEQSGDRMVISYASFLRPTGLYEVQIKDGKLRELATVEAPDVSNFVVEQLDYPSYDGTRVPMFVLRRKDVKPSGENPTLLTGYGGFNVSITPRFSPSALYWVEQGGVYAVANLRGGAELGEEWHDAGKLENKHQVFRDFEYAMRHLIRAKWTKPEKLAITGGSNGGLLMGAMMTQAPELFRACIGRVGLYDMVRFDIWPPAELWVDEYGSSKNADQVGYLLGYSPYHQVLPGVEYPSFLGLTARADTRVTWIHTAKFVAALQEATAGKAPILFHLEEKAGHGAGKGRSDRVKEEVMMFQFIASELGMAEAVPAPARR